MYDYERNVKMEAKNFKVGIGIIVKHVSSNLGRNQGSSSSSQYLVRVGGEGSRERSGETNKQCLQAVIRPLLIHAFTPSIPRTLPTMIPPCDPTVLENNPQFKKLYQNLTLNLLNPDGSTRAHDAQPDRKSVTEVC